MPLHRAVTQVVLPCWASLATAMHTALQRTAITVGHGVGLMRSTASTSPQRGVQYVPPSCVNTLCAGTVSNVDAWCLPWWLTTCNRSRTVVHALIGSTSKPCVCRVTTVRQGMTDAADAGVGVSNLYRLRPKMRAPAQIFARAN